MIQLDVVPTSQVISEFIVVPHILTHAWSCIGCAHWWPNARRQSARRLLHHHHVQVVLLVHSRIDHRDGAIRIRNSIGRVLIVRYVLLCRSGVSL